jgi:hypothetical protein
MGVGVAVRVGVGVGVRVAVGVGAGVLEPGYTKLTPAMSSLLRPAHRPSKCAYAANVALVSLEWPKPMVWPNSCVATSATLHAVQSEHPPQPLLNVNFPATIWLKVAPLTTLVLYDEQ